MMPRASDEHEHNDYATKLLRTGRKLDDRYVLAGFLIVLCIGVFAFAADGRLGRIVASGLQGVTLLVILHTSHARPRTIRLAAVVTAVALVGVTIGSAGGSPLARAAPALLAASLALVAPLVILRRLIQQPAIDFSTVAGALCVYLLAGLFFALAFAAGGLLAHGEFFVQKDSGTAVDYVYYSFVTLTTVGYGDLTARHDFARICSILESLFGQLYLVSVVALLVANIGRTRRAP